MQVHVCSAPYAYAGPYAYGTSHMRILIWDAHTRMGQQFVPNEYDYNHAFWRIIRTLNNTALTVTIFIRKSMMSSKFSFLNHRYYAQFLYSICDWACKNKALPAHKFCQIFKI